VGVAGWSASRERGQPFALLLIVYSTGKCKPNVDISQPSELPRRRHPFPPFVISPCLHRCRCAPKQLVEHGK